METHEVKNALGMHLMALIGNIGKFQQQGEEPDVDLGELHKQAEMIVYDAEQLRDKIEELQGGEAQR